MRTSSVGRSTGGWRSRRAFATLKMVVLTPSPSAMESRALAVKTGRRRSWRRASAKFMVPGRGWLPGVRVGSGRVSEARGCSPGNRTVAADQEDALDAAPDREGIEGNAFHATQPDDGATPGKED